MRNASNTGYISLQRSDGNLTIYQPETVIDGWDIHGSVTIKAPFVTIRRSIIRGGTPPTSGSNGLLNIVNAGAGGYLIEDVTLVPDYPNVRQNGVYVNKPGRFRRIDLSGTVDGIVVYGNGVEVLDSYLHDFVTYPSDPNQGGKPSHSDGIQVQAGQGVTIRGTTIIGANNAAIMVTQDAGTVSNLTIEGNYLDDGGCSINFGSAGPPKTGLIVRNNRFGHHQRVSGCAIIRNATASPLTESGNVWDDTGQPIVVTRGA